MEEESKRQKMSQEMNIDCDEPAPLSDKTFVATFTDRKFFEQGSPIPDEVYMYFLKTLNERLGESTLVEIFADIYSVEKTKGREAAEQKLTGILGAGDNCNKLEVLKVYNNWVEAPGKVHTSSYGQSGLPDSTDDTFSPIRFGVLCRTSARTVQLVG